MTIWPAVDSIQASNHHSTIKAPLAAGAEVVSLFALNSPAYTSRYNLVAFYLTRTADLRGANSSP